LSNFLKRSITGLFFVITLIGAIWYDHLTAIALFAMVALIGFNEFLKLVKVKNPQTLALNSIVTISFWILVSQGKEQLVLLLLTTYLIIQLIRFVLDFKSELSSLTKEVFGLLYLNIPFYVLYLIGKSEYDYQPWLMLMIFFMVWANDTGAYLVGRSFGKTKLYEKLSPKKTWEGTIGGLLISMIIAFVLAEFVFDWNGFIYLGAAVLTGISATVGDLFESKLKRSAGVKDSGTILPGHGGILDRFDALFLAAPVNYVYFSLLA